MYIEGITVDDIQRFFNDMEGKKATKNKAKIVLNQIFESALEDGYITKNPLKSKRLKITGAENKTTNIYTVEQMQYLIEHINDLESNQDKLYLALISFHPLRLEELLGMRWCDVDIDNKLLHINIAVTHPDRNKPEIKETKTKSSVRTLSLADFAIDFLKLLDCKNQTDFILGGKDPLSYEQVKHTCVRIGKQTKFIEVFNDKIASSRFRPTTLTNIYNQTKDIKLTQAVAGHTTSAMTLKHYVKNVASAQTATESVGSLYIA